MKPIISFRTLPAALCCLLVALAAWSCTADTDPLPDGGTTPGDDPAALNIFVGPRPAFTEGTAVLPDGMEADAGAATAQSGTPATRAIQTDTGAEWEKGDVIWLRASFYWTSDGAKQKNYISALRYTDTNGDGTCEWRPFTEQDSIDYQTDGIKPEGFFSGFVRHPRWPAEALAKDVKDAQANVAAYYLGKGIPVDGIVSMGYTVDEMMAFTTSVGPGESAALNVEHDLTRLHVTAGAKLELKNAGYYDRCRLNTLNPSSGFTNLSIDVPAGGGDYFVKFYGDPQVTLDGIPYTLPIGKNAYDTWDGMSYTLTPVKNSGVSPGD